MSKIYEIFAEDWKDSCDWSDQSLIDLYNYESYGGQKPDSRNGFALGKKYLAVTLKMWKEDIALGTLFKHELYEDPKFPHWWLDSIFR